MSLLSKITLGFVAIAALVLFYMAARTLSTHANHRKNFEDHQKALSDERAKTAALLAGDAEKNVPSLNELQVALDKELFRRGRVWRNCVPRFDPRSGAVTLAVPPLPPRDPEKPSPGHQLEENNVVYVFEKLEPPGPGRYVGEFKVVQAAPDQVILEPTLPQTSAKQQLLARAQGPWTLYELLPADNNEVFADYTDQEIQSNLPKAPARFQGESDADFQARNLEYQALVKEYLKDGKAPADDDPPERIRTVVKFTKDFEQLDQNAQATLASLKIPTDVVKSGQVWKFDKATADQFVALEIAQEVERSYERRLRDYAYFFREVARQIPLKEDRLAEAAKNDEHMTRSVKVAEDQVVSMKEHIEALTEERDRMQAEAKAAQTLRTSLTQDLERTDARTEELLGQNRQLAAELKQNQQRAAKQPYRETAAVVSPKPR